MKDQELEISYSSLWKSIIRPPRDVYTQDLMGDCLFTFKGITYQRKDHDLLNDRGEILKCSFVEPMEESRVSFVFILADGNNASCHLFTWK